MKNDPIAGIGPEQTTTKSIEMQHLTIPVIATLYVLGHWFYLLWVPPVEVTEEDRTRAPFAFVEVSIDENGKILWSTLNEHDPLPFYIEQYAYNKWMRVGMIYGEGESDTVDYHYRAGALLNSGNNVFRIRRETGEVLDDYSPQVSIQTELPRVYHFQGKDQILLSRRGYFYLYDEVGVMVRKGYGSVIALDKLLRGEYFLCYDNRVERVKIH